MPLKDWIKERHMENFFRCGGCNTIFQARNINDIPTNFRCRKCLAAGVPPPSETSLRGRSAFANDSRSHSSARVDENTDIEERMMTYDGYASLAASMHSGFNGGAPGEWEVLPGQYDDVADSSRHSRAGRRGPERTGTPPVDYSEYGGSRASGQEMRGSQRSGVLTQDHNTSTGGSSGHSRAIGWEAGAASRHSRISGWEVSGFERGGRIRSVHVDGTGGFCVIPGCIGDDCRGRGRR